MMSSRYSSPVWAVLEYLGLFAMVTMHEFGHALACRQTGGQAEKIFLWPLGGIAFVSPPNRPGAMLWSIAAGPLVNVALVPILWAAQVGAARAGWPNHNLDAYLALTWLGRINLALLIFNLLPIYPLDGGQILRSLLWFPFGQVRSLFIATAIGFAGGAALLLAALWWQSFWIGFMAFFLLSRAGAGWKQARYLQAEDAEVVMGIPPQPELPEKKAVL